MNSEIMLERLNELIEFYKKENEELKKELEDTHAVVKETEEKLEAAIKGKENHKELGLTNLFTETQLADKLDAVTAIELSEDKMCSYLDLTTEIKMQKDQNALNGNLPNSCVKRYSGKQDYDVIPVPSFGVVEKNTTKKSKKKNK